MKENRFLHEICHNCLALYDLSIYQLLVEWLAEFPTILDSIITGIANTSSTPTGWEGGRWADSHKMVGKGYV